MYDAHVQRKKATTIEAEEEICCVQHTKTGIVHVVQLFHHRFQRSTLH
jgi:hypothetical protein